MKLNICTIFLSEDSQDTRTDLMKPIFTSFTEFYYKNNDLILSWSGSVQEQVVRGLMGLGCFGISAMVIVPVLLSGSIGGLILLPLLFPGVLIAFSKYEAKVDASNRIITYYWRCLSFRKVMSTLTIPTLIQLRLRSEEQIVVVKTPSGDKETKHDDSATLSIISKGEVHSEGDVILTQRHMKSGDPSQEIFIVRQLSEVIAKHLSLDIVDCYQGDKPLVRHYERLDETVLEQWQRRINEGEEFIQLEEPLILRSKIIEQYESTRIEMPPLDWKYGSQRLALIVACAIIMFGEMSILLAMGPEAQKAIPVLALIETMMLIGASFWLLKGCFWGDKIELNSESLTLKRGFNSVVFPLSEFQKA